MTWAAGLTIPLTMLAMLIKTQHCSCGPGWGLPLQPYHVVCGEKFGNVFEWTWMAFVPNIIFWFVIAMPLALVIEFVRDRRRKAGNPAEPATPPYSEPAARTPRG